MEDKKIWSGRFNSETNPEVENFTESISFDYRLAKYDVKVSIAHILMLAKCGIINELEKEKIIKVLNKALNLIQKNKFKFDVFYEDVHSNIENFVIKELGETGMKLHTARSRNDLVVTDIRLYLKDEIKDIISLLKDLLSEIVFIAENNISNIMPSYTHLKQAQPILISHYFMAFFFRFKEDIERLKKNLESVDVLTLGSGAVAGVNYPIDREFLAKLLNFSKISENSIDAVSDRDFIIEFIFNSSLIAMHLSRLAEDLIIYNTDEFGFIEISDEFATGSSIMPHKKNPDVLELIRGKTASIYSNLIGILILLKALPTSYNRDLQEDKKFLFSTCDNIKPMISIFTKLLKNIKFNYENINSKMKSGFIIAVDIADYLVKKGTPFRKAHNIVGKIIKYCIQKNKSLFELTLDELKKFKKNIDEDIFKLFDYKKSVELKISYGGTSTDNVLRQIASAKKYLSS